MYKTFGYVFQMLGRNSFLPESDRSEWFLTCGQDCADGCTQKFSETGKGSHRLAPLPQTKLVISCELVLDLFASTPFCKKPVLPRGKRFFYRQPDMASPSTNVLSKLPRLPMVRDWPSQFFGLFPRALCRYGPTMPLRIRFVLVDERPQHQRTSSQEAKWNPRCPPGRPENRGLRRLE